MALLENNLMIKHERTLTKWQRLFRCNSGHAWSGEFLKPEIIFKRFKIKLSFPILIKLRKILLWPKGTPDKIGFDSFIITPDMVGKRVAVFVGAEYKTGDQALNDDQVNFKKLLVKMGARHREIRDDGRVIESGFI